VFIRKHKTLVFIIKHKTSLKFKLESSKKFCYVANALEKCKEKICENS